MLFPESSFFHTMLTLCSQSNGSMLLLLPDRLSTGLEKGPLGWFRGLLKNGQQLQCWKRDAEMAFQLQRYQLRAEDMFRAITRPRSHPAAFLLWSNVSYLSSGSAWGDNSWLCWLMLGQGKRSSPALAVLAARCLCWLPSCRPGLQPGAQPEPLSCPALCITHKTGSCIPVLVLSPVLQGTRTKHSAGTEKHCIQMNLSWTCKWKKIWYGLYWEIKHLMIGFILVSVSLAIRITRLFLISHYFYRKLLWFSCLNPDLHPSQPVEIIINYFRQNRNFQFCATNLNPFFYLCCQSAQSIWKKGRKILAVQPRSPFVPVPYACQSPAATLGESM